MAAPFSAAAQEGRGELRTLDSFESVSAWSPHPSDGVSLDIHEDTGRGGGVMRLDFDFHGHAGYAIARRKVDIDLPENYEFDFQVRGETPPQNLEFKLLDSTGDNVWWHNAPNFEFGESWTRVRYRARDISFAWGPIGGGKPKHIAAIEIVVTAGHGGRGTVWVDDLTLRTLPPPRPYDLVPAVSASSSAAKSEPALAFDGDTSTVWRSGAGGEQWLAADFQRVREYGGLTIDWAAGAHAADYSVDTSSDGRRWTAAYTVRGSDGGRDYIPLRYGESRWLRIAMRRGEGDGYALREVIVQPPGWADSANALFRHIAADAPRGSFPRYLYEEQSYWTIVGVDGGYHNGLLNEDGMLESDRGSFSVEPFLYRDGRLITWADVERTQSLARGYLPIPSAEWDAGKLSLTTTVFAYGDSTASTLVARYRVRNTASDTLRATLFLAIRPFQVNPPWQFLNVPGGVAPIRSIAREGDAIVVNGDRRVIPVTRGATFGAASFDEGGVAPRLREGRLPARGTATDSAGRASGALAFALVIPPGAARDVAIELPFPVGDASDSSRSSPRTAMRLLRDSADVERTLAAAEEQWAALLDRVRIELPPAAMDVVRTLRTTIAYILINRDGPRIQPGSRSYSRSWIRDGSLESAALLRMGYPRAVRDFAEWYAPFQYPSGKVPCCVDSRGADPVPENDSHGELIFLVMEYYRYTHDHAFLERMWPHIAGAVAYIDTLRAERMTPEYRTPEKRAYFGILPQSISHEGYSAKPMHSYWDDLFALRGLKDAAFLAGVLGRRDDAARLGALRDEFRGHLVESYQRAMEMHGIDYLPGSVELGDFDATSTTVALAPVDEAHHLPAAALAATFDRYLREFRERRDGTRAWDAYTPYELRSVGTMVRMGRKAEAHELLDYFLRDRRPAGWNQWAEVVWREYREPKFIGDMPHTWVGSDFIRSVLDMFAYERGADSALVVGAGVPAEWVAGPGLRVRGLGTHYGPLDLDMRMEGDAVHVRIAGALRIPRGGIVLRSPLDRPVERATVNGAPAAVRDRGLRIRRVPAEVVLEYR
ncbi:MAG TPA: discoidin domain-containing protein [Gemmatimonadaceae bacterium]